MSSATRRILVRALTLMLAAPGAALVHAQPADDFVPVTDAMLENPAPADWLMWRRTLNGWGYSPLEQIDRDNVGDLRLVWTRALAPGSQQGTPLAYGGIVYMPNPNDIIQAIDAVTGDLRWEYRRDLPDDIDEYIRGLSDVNRNVAIYGNLIIDTSNDDYIYAVDATSGRLVWETEILDYTKNPARHSSGPIIARGKAVSGRCCRPWAGPEACVIVAHDATTGAELWRRRLVPAPGEPGDETWGDVPYEDRVHVGAWMVPSIDPTLNRVYVGTSVTSPAPKFLRGGADNTHLYHNSTLALDFDTGEIVWYYQDLNDHWDLDHPFERLLVDTAVAPDPAAVSWINPRLRPGDVRKVVTGIPGKTGVVYTLDRETGEFLWATPTVTQNVISHIDGGTGAVTPNAELVFSAEGQEVLACPSWFGGKDWEAGAYSPLTNTMYFPLRNVCGRMLASRDAGSHYALAVRNQLAPGTDQVGTVQAISAETGTTRWIHEQRAATMSLVATGGGRAGVRGRRERTLPGVRPRDRRGAVGDQSRLGRHRFPDHLRRGGPSVCRGEHRLCRHRIRLPRVDARAPPERREQPVRVCPAGPRLRARLALQQPGVVRVVRRPHKGSTNLHPSSSRCCNRLRPSPQPQMTLSCA